MIIEVLFVVVMLLWFLSVVPHPSMAPFASASGYLAFFAVLLLGVYVFMPALRG